MLVDVIWCLVCSPRCRFLLVLVFFFSSLIVKGEGTLVEEDSSSSLSSGSYVKAKSFIYCYCDELVCWFHGIIEGRLILSVYSYVGRGNHYSDNKLTPRHSVIPPRQKMGCIRGGCVRA